MKPGLQVGATGELSVRVTPQNSIALGPAPGFPVFATPYLIELMERAARKAVEDYLEQGEVTVGTEVNLRHIAGTPVRPIVEGWGPIEIPLLVRYDWKGKQDSELPDMCDIDGHKPIRSRPHATSGAWLKNVRFSRTAVIKERRLRHGELLSRSVILRAVTLSAWK